MKTLSYFVILVTLIVGMHGCGTKTPSCSDEDTIKLVKETFHQALIDSATAAGIDNSVTNNIFNKLGVNVSAITTASHDEKIGKYQCNASFETKLSGKSAQIINTPLFKMNIKSDLSLSQVKVADDSITNDIQYSSQLTDDKKQHITYVTGLKPIVDIVIALGVLELSGQPTQQQAPAQQDINNTTAPSASTIVGTWKGQLEGEGEMMIKPASAGYDVTLTVSATTAAGSPCNGSIEGNAFITDNTLILHKQEDGIGCTVKMQFHDNKADITEVDNCSYHGAACSFNGTLVKQ